jgi:hypothetical protein
MEKRRAWKVEGAAGSGARKRVTFKTRQTKIPVLKKFNGATFGVKRGSLECKIFVFPRLLFFLCCFFPFL